MADHTDMKLGKRPAQFDHRAHSMRALASAFRISEPPPYWRVDWDKKLPANTGVMLNDHLGCCTCSALGHFIQNVTAWTEPAMVTVPDSAILAAYEQACGYNPADPSTDQGGIITKVMDYFRTTGVAGHHIDGWVTCQPGNFNDIKSAIWLCGACNAGVALPISAQTQDVWSVTSTSGDGEPGSWGGHDILVNKWDDHEREVEIQTWGIKKIATYDWLQTYMDEGYGMVSKDWLMKSGLTPSDINYPNLLAFIASGF